jgi:hypothetical protein
VDQLHRPEGVGECVDDHACCWGHREKNLAVGVAAAASDKTTATPVRV